MTREVWFKEELGQILLAVGEASRSAGQAMPDPGAGAGDRCSSTRLMQAYQTGFQAALHSLALAFGLLDVAGSLPRRWVGVLDREPVEAVRPEILGSGNAARSAAEDGMTRVWVEEDCR